jgi:HPt (histidine-containing phosphotransfer) domain-containing protein
LSLARSDPEDGTPERCAPELPLRLIGSIRPKHEDFSASSIRPLQQALSIILPPHPFLAPLAEDAVSDLPIIHVDELMARLGGSREVLGQLAPVLTQSAATWQAELRAALTAGDAERLRRAAHQAKGGLLTFAAHRAAASAKALEDAARTGDLTSAPAMVEALLAEVTAVAAAVGALL